MLLKTWFWKNSRPRYFKTKIRKRRSRLRKTNEDTGKKDRRNKLNTNAFKTRKRW